MRVAFLKVSRVPGEGCNTTRCCNYCRGQSAFGVMVEGRAVIEGLRESGGMLRLLLILGNCA